jgi:hypothetical protein
MPSVRRREALAHEHVAQVAAAVRALDLDPHTVRVRKVTYGSLDLLVERRPPTVSVELIDRPV